MYQKKGGEVFSSYDWLRSESVTSAATTDLQVALLAIIDPSRHTLEAHLALVATSETPEVGVFTIVASLELFCHPEDST
jgi:hypothetical protein